MEFQRSLSIAHAHRRVLAWQYHLDDQTALAVISLSRNVISIMRTQVSNDRFRTLTDPLPVPKFSRLDSSHQSVDITIMTTMLTAYSPQALEQRMIVLLNPYRKYSSMSGHEECSDAKYAEFTRT
jgi:hypothetical protein